MRTDSGERNSRLPYRLRGLGMAGAVLHIGAHPDDECIGLLTYLTGKFAVRAVYWSATRGEGGQNRINAYREEALGIYRSWESLAASGVDGAERLFGPFYDFGYSKNGEEALAKWGRRAVVREIVRAIRLVQPQIIVARWTGTPRDEHGHHQAVGQATLEAFEAAGDPGHFPELGAQGLPAWQPLKLYQSTTGDWQPGQEGVSFGQLNPDLEREGVVQINSGEFDPIAGQSYQERALIAFNHHKTQAMGMAPAPGDFFDYFSLLKSLVPLPARERNLFEGLDPSLTGLAECVGAESPWLRQGLAEVKAHAEEAIRQFRADDPIAASTALLGALALLGETRRRVENDGGSSEAWKALGAYLARKSGDFESVIAQCLGLELECLSERARIIPGQRFRVSARLWNHRGIAINRVAFGLRLPQGWEARQVEPETLGGDSAPPGQPAGAYDITAAATADLTCPYWLAEPREAYAYTWPKGEPCSRPFGPAPVQVTCEASIGPHRINLEAAAVRREAFPGGYRELPVAVIPPISLHPVTSREFLQVREAKQRRPVRSRQDLTKFLDFLQESLSDQHLELQVVARNNGYEAVEGNVELIVPQGWKVAPEQVQLSLGKPGDATTVRFVVTVPASTQEGRYPLRYTVHCAERDYGAVVTPVRMGAGGLSAPTDSTNCIQEEFLLTPAQVSLHLISVQFVHGLKYAYIQGIKEESLDALQPFGIECHLITDDEMSHLDLSGFDAVLVGPNAYLARDELRKNAPRLLDYVKGGGTLIVQYQAYGFERGAFAPYPFRYNEPHDRVTHPDAPVTILDPEDVLFHVPNRIGPGDFGGWVRDRGLYFFGQWDKRYRPLLASADPGEEPHKGGLVECQYGRGTYLYLGYSFFRQLPAGVAGAFRLFANILALPAARILERIEVFKGLPLFSGLAEDHLEALVRIASERWAEDGAYICRPGEIGDDLYVVYQGEVELVTGSSDREQVRLARAGDCIGRLGLIGQDVSTASLRARGDAHVLVLEHSQFQPLLRQHPDVAIQVIKFLTSRLAVPAA